MNNTITKEDKDQVENLHNISRSIVTDLYSLGYPPAEVLYIITFATCSLIMSIEKPNSTGIRDSYRKTFDNLCDLMAKHR